MKKHFEQLPRFSFSAAGIATGSILALIVAMAVSLVLDLRPVDIKASVAAANAVSAHS